MAWLMALTLLGAAPAAAQDEPPSPREQAQLVFREGQAFFEQGQFREAAARFLSAFQLDPHPIIMFNIARAYEEAGDLLQALQHFRAAKGLNPSEAVLAEIKVKISDLEAFLRDQGVDIVNVEAATWVPRGFVSVISDPPGAEILIAGQLVGRAPLDKLVLTQGDYIVTARLRGYLSQEREITVVGGKAYVLKPQLSPGSEADPAQLVQAGALDVTAPRRGLLVFVDGEPIATTPVGRIELPPGRHLVSIEGEGFPTYEEAVEVVHGEVARVIAPNPKPPEIVRKDTSLLTDREWAWVSLGSGAGALGLGALLGSLALGESSTYQDDRADPARPDARDRAFALGIGADISYGVGLGLVTVGVLLLLYGEDEQDAAFEQELVLWPGLRLQPQALQGGAGLSASGAW
jgi:tetratricopeptide (TPR) repeat protein